MAFAAVLPVPALPVPALQPAVKEYRTLSENGFAPRDLPVVYEDRESCEIAAGEVRASERRTAYDGKALPPDGVFIATAASAFGRKLVAAFALDVPAKKQGYALKAEKRRVAIVGFDPAGTLYGAETFRQMAAEGVVREASVRDWPDILYRGNVSAGRGLWPFGEYTGDRMKTVKEGLDELARMKINVICDFFWVNPESDGKQKAWWHEVNRYARARGIYPNDYGSTAVYFRRNAPKGVTFDNWPCVKGHASWDDWFYCWADDGLTEAAAERYAEYLIAIGAEQGISIIHPVDGGSWQDPEQWSRRCAKCRAKWNDHERWKASVNQFDIWTRVLKRRCPDLLVGSCIYPYTFNALTTPAKDRSPKWAESMPEYWQKLDRNLESKEFFFSSWVAAGHVMREVRKLVPTRPLHFSDTYPEASGIFHAYNRKACTVWEAQGENMFCTQGIDTRPRWESVALVAECTWNKDAPCAEVYDGGTYYDPLVDHAGDTPVFTEALPRICRAFWGGRLAPHMTEVMGSGVMPEYIRDAAAQIKYWNAIRKDPMFDPLGNGAKTEPVKRFAPIADSAERMGEQAKAAEKCVAALQAAEGLLGDLGGIKRVAFMSLAKNAPFWLATARARYALRRVNAMFFEGRNAEALTLLTSARAQAAADYAAAAANLERLKKEPDGRGFRYAWPVSQEKIMMDFDHAEASAKVTLKPRRVGRHIRVGITRAPSAAGVKEYLDRFANVKAEIIESLAAAELDRFDCVFVLSAPRDKDEVFRNLRAYVETCAGGLYLEADVCGLKRFDERMLFPEIMCGPAAQGDPVTPDLKRADGSAGKAVCANSFPLKAGPKGAVAAASADGRPVAVKGAQGLGKVFYNGTVHIEAIAGTAAGKPSELSGWNAGLVKQAIEYFTGIKLKVKQ